MWLHSIAIPYISMDTEQALFNKGLNKNDVMISDIYIIVFRCLIIIIIFTIINSIVIIVRIDCVCYICASM